MVSTFKYLIYKQVRIKVHVCVVTGNHLYNEHLYVTIFLNFIYLF